MNATPSAATASTTAKAALVSNISIIDPSAAAATVSVIEPSSTLAIGRADYLPLSFSDVFIIDPSITESSSAPDVSKLSRQ